MEALAKALVAGNGRFYRKGHDRPQAALIDAPIMAHHENPDPEEFCGWLLSRVRWTQGDTSTDFGLERNQSPSWTHIEPCASPRSRTFGGYLSKPET